MQQNQNDYEYCGIKLDLNRDSLLGEQGLRYLTTEGFYKKPNETTPQETFARGAACYSFGDHELVQRIYDYASKHWFTFASPVLSNALPVKWPKFKKSEFAEAAQWLKENVKAEGLPISCFLNAISDSKQGLTVNSAETKELSMAGGGIGTYMGNRSPDSKSTGVMAHAKEYDAITLAYKQAESRRGSIAMYLAIDHPEIMNFIGMRDPTGGDMNKKCFNLNHGINITDKFMRQVINGEDFALIDPKHGDTGQKLNAREVWEKILETRKETGEPYLLFIDTVNANIPKWITKPTYKVQQSNLCVVGSTIIQVRVNGQVKNISMLELINSDEEFEVLSYNTETKQKEFKKVTAKAKTAENADLVRVTAPNGKTLVCTPDHRVFTENRGYVEAKNLKSTDILNLK